MPKLTISTAADCTMRADAEATFPDECCGFFYGTEAADGSRSVTEAQVVENTKEGDKRRRFAISPLQYLRAERYAEQRELTLLGVYHSHPQHPAVASEHDLAVAMPYFSYVIYSVIDGQIADVRSWRLTDDGTRFEAEAVAIEMS